MTRTMLTGISELFTGDIDAPRRSATSLLLVDDTIAAFDPPAGTPVDRTIDVRGAAVMPGFVDGHVHPVVGEWTPTQNAQGWVHNYVHGGTTTLISAGELHLPGLNPDNLTPELVTSWATVTALTAPAAVPHARLHAGTLLLVPGLRPEHFDRVAEAGSILAKFLFFPFSDTSMAEARNYVTWCRERGMRTKVHTGGVSRSGRSAPCGYDVLAALEPDLAAHVSGGPIPMPDADLDRVVADLELPLEICSSMNYGATLRVVRQLAERGQLHRLIMGTDTPGGTGVIPRGMLRNILFLTSIAGLETGTAVAIASGNTARAHGLRQGVVDVGRPADLVVCGRVEGSSGATLTETIAHGDLPGISHVIVGGRVVVDGRSEQTPPPTPAMGLGCPCSDHGPGLDHVDGEVDG